MKKTKQRTTFTQKEIQIALNNAVAQVSNSTATIGQTEGQKRRIFNYALELARLLHEDVEDGYLRSEELAHALTAAGLTVWCLYVMNTTRVPHFQDMAKRHLEGESE